MTKTILITGGIGSGKSEVSAVLRSLGYPVYDSDSRTKGLYDSVPGLLEAVEKALGCGPLRTEDGRLDRRTLAGIVFSDAAKMELLQRVVYPAVAEDFVRWRSSFDGPVFFESAVASAHPEFDGLFDAVLLVTADEEKRLERVLARDKGAGREEVLARMRSQEVPSGPDYVIVNNGGLRSLKNKTKDFLDRL